MLIVGVLIRYLYGYTVSKRIEVPKIFFHFNIFFYWYYPIKIKLNRLDLKFKNTNLNWDKFI